MTTNKGIDVSHDQGLIDWNGVRESGARFAMIYLGACGHDGCIADNEGVDRHCNRNLRGAVRAGVPVGAWVACCARTPRAARAAAGEALALVADHSLRYPLALEMGDDWQRNQSRETNTAIARAFVERVEEAGYLPLLHTDRRFAEEKLDRAEELCDLWLSEYDEQLHYSGRVGIWQHAVGECEGIAEGCSWNVAYKPYNRIVSAGFLNQPGIALSREQVCANRALITLLSDVVR